MMPAFGLSAVPLPTKNRRMLPGCHAPTADADGELTAAEPTSDAAGSAGSALEVVAAAALAVAEPEPSSRRVTAAAAQASGAAAGEPPPLPDASHDSRPEPIESTDPRGAAVITGTFAGTSSTAAAGAGVAIDPTAEGGAGIGAGAPESVPLVGSRIGAGSASVPPGLPAMSSDGSGVASAGASSAITASEFLRRGTAVSAVAATGFCPRATRGTAPPVFAASSEPDPDGTDPASAEPRPLLRGARAAVDLREEVDESAALDPLEPAEPVVSAKAIGSEPRPEPTPRATASAPTRPIYHA